ncbi:MAG TPA: sarcosine oxidase subunit gamma family protein [Casimicrobiaceae bacterium]|nr:sarcosine oxidase subunit gamma family protein [Casimicrobiaceae bacterium]
MSESPDTTIGSTAPGHYGAAGSAVFLSEATIATAWNVQGNLASSSFRAEVQRIAGIALPEMANTASMGNRVVALWLGPQSWLLVAADVASLGDFTGARDALIAAGGALFDVSAGRVAYVVDGPSAADVLAAGCPLDFDPRAFSAGQCRQSLYGRVPVLFYRHREPPACTMLIARSFARDSWHSLCTAAAPYGYTVRAAGRFA